MSAALAPQGPAIAVATAAHSITTRPVRSHAVWAPNRSAPTFYVTVERRGSLSAEGVHDIKGGRAQQYDEKHR